MILNMQSIFCYYFILPSSGRNTCRNTTSTSPTTPAFSNQDLGQAANASRGSQWQRRLPLVLIHQHSGHQSQRSVSAGRELKSLDFVSTGRAARRLEKRARSLLGRAKWSAGIA